MLVQINCVYHSTSIQLFIHQLFDDFALVRPTIISSTPRFWNLLYNQYLNVLYHEYKLYVKSASAQEDKVQGGEDHVGPLQGQELVSKVKEDDNNSATKNIDARHVPEEVRKTAMKKFSSILGGRQRMVSTGGAPTAPAVKDFLEECFSGLFHEGYGASEVTMRVTYLFSTSITGCGSILFLHHYQYH